MSGENRARYFVLMAGGLSDEEDVLSDDPVNADFRKKVGEARLREFINASRWVDPANFVAHAAPSAVLLQYGTQDQLVPVKKANHYASLVSEPKEVRFYDADHALNADARRDRYQFLRKWIGLKELGPEVLAKVPQVR